MNCTQNMCQCGAYRYFNDISLVCQDQTTNNSACIANNTCRVDKGLTCQNELCQCDLTNQFWHRAYNKCIDLMGYNGQGCEINSNCRDDENLFCNLDSSANQCNCPSLSAGQMCDWRRAFSNELFWNGSYCEQACTYAQSCNATYEYNN